MAKERRDNKNRLLRTGESQRADGRYEYRYVDHGVRRCVYSYRLTESDKCTKGRKITKSLRELEREIEQALALGENYYNARCASLNDRVDLYLSTKQNLKQTSYENYRYMYDQFVRKSFGMKKLAEIHYSDMLKFYFHLLNDEGIQVNTLETIQNTIHPALKMAVRDGTISTNPSDGIIGEIKKTIGWEEPKRHALTDDQQERLLSFLDNKPEYKRWQDILTLLLGTGCRIGELIGLCWENVDFDGRTITIDHSLSYHKGLDGKCRWHLSTPKTKAGIRKIPMFEDVYAVLLELHENQEKKGFCKTVIEGKKGFILIKRNGDPYKPGSINNAFKRILADYNFTETLDAQEHDRKPVLMPEFSAHHLRHTFCTRICENVTNIPVIKELMGHRDIQTTLNIYNEVQESLVKRTFDELECKFRIR